MAELIPRGKDKQGKERFLVKVFWQRDATGKREFHCKTITGKKEADAYARAKETERDKGKPKPARLTLNYLLDQWLHRCQSMHTIRESTLEWYTFLMKKYARPILGDSKLASLKSFHFEDLYMELERQGLSGRSIRLVHARLVTAFEYAVGREYLDRNPVSKATAPKVVKKEMDFFSKEEAQQFIEASRQDSRGVLLRFAVFTGLRPEEYCGLKWNDLELDGSKRGVVHVRRALKWLKGGRWKFDEPKTEKSKRVVYFPLSMARELSEHKRQQLEERLRVGRHYQNKDFVFASEAGIPLRINLITYRHFRPTLERAGLRQIRLYDLRHTWVTLSLLSGVSPKTVSEQAGHSSVTFTLDHYAHVLSSEREGASDKLETLLFSGVVNQ